MTGRLKEVTHVLVMLVTDSTKYVDKGRGMNVSRCEIKFTQFKYILRRIEEVCWSV